MSKSMEELVQLARKGNQEAIAALYEQTYNSVYQSVRAVIKDEDEALDIIQDSYIKGFQNLDKLADPEKYLAWMKTIATNQARDYLRKKRPALFSERVDEDGEEIDLKQQDECLDHMPEAVIDRKETTRLMNDILGVLSEEQRLAIVMFYYEERSVREIAEILSCSENTVKSRLNYGRKKIEAEVRALEKKGTKLYSLAPLPFFIWLLRTAKGYGISAEAVAQTSAVGVAGTAAAAGESAVVSASSSASGSAAAGATAKTAGTVAGKTLATKIVAGTLAVSMTVGAGAITANKINQEKENTAAHIAYEDIVERYKVMSAMDDSERFYEETLFWEELLESTLNKYCNNLHCDDTETGPSQSGWAFAFKWGQDFEEGIPLPNTVYFPTMEMRLNMAHYRSIDDEEYTIYYSIYYAISDVDNDGIDDLIIWGKGKNPTGRYEHDENWIRIHSLIDGYLISGEVKIIEHDNGKVDWFLEAYGRGYPIVKDGIEYSLGVGGPSSSEVSWRKSNNKQKYQYTAPTLDWIFLCD